MVVFPNPTSGLFSVSVANELFKVVVMDATGKVVERYNQIANKLDVDLRAYANGVYWVEVFTNDNRFVQKIVLNK